MGAREQALKELRRATRALSGACLERMVRGPDAGGRRSAGLPQAFMEWLAGEGA